MDFSIEVVPVVGIASQRDHIPRVSLDDIFAENLGRVSVGRARIPLETPAARRGPEGKHDRVLVPELAAFPIGRRPDGVALLRVEPL